MKTLLERDTEAEVTIPAGEIELEGTLHIPPHAEGVVLFAHGSGSSRFSVRNRFVAGVLQDGGLATLLIDLLSSDEETLDMQTGHLRFDIPFLARRLIQVAHWLHDKPETAELNLGMFGSSTGGGAALLAAAQEPDLVKAVVSRGGRPDLAGAALRHVRAPTLLIVGGNDYLVIDMNEEAMQKLNCEKQMKIVPDATHLFEEPGALETVADLACDWFREKLSSKHG